MTMDTWAKICKRLGGPRIDSAGWESIPGLSKRFTNSDSEDENRGLTDQTKMGYSVLSGFEN